MTDWITRWKEGKIGWHKNQPNSKLIEFIDCLELGENTRVFVPLCGKSVDMLYFLEKSFKVLGVELSELAVEQFFVENKLDFTMKKSDKFMVFSAKNIDIYCGDYFDLNAQILSQVSAVYDRGALIALPADLRVKYTQHLEVILPSNCRLLLLTLNYPQVQIDGPPFAVNQAEVEVLFKGFECQQLQCFDDIQNEPKFQEAGVEFLEKAAYYLCKDPYKG
ncbi:Thiopurine S-methyltransferase [uncultured Candidatus Thioglobus sp.]|nr:Thiopurine S-methyltransferase [uncultured Candidatus Thioglobus sp.]